MWELVVKVNQSTTGRMNDFSKKQDHSSDRFSDFIFSQLRSRSSSPEKNEGCGQSFKNNPFVLDHLHSHCTYTAVCSFLLFFDEKCSLFVI
jgi:hypothetical protein